MAPPLLLRYALRMDGNDDSQSEALPFSGIKKRVLAVDDEEEILRLYETFLGFTDYEVVAVTNAEECMRFLKSEIADILLLDINMPGIDGLQVLEFIRANEKLNGMRVFMISAKRDEETVRKAMLLGCDGYIVKPFKLAELERRIAMELISISIEDIRALVNAGVSVKTALFREPGIQEFSPQQWDPYPVKHAGMNLCLMVPRGVRPTHFVKAPADEVEKRVVVMFKHPTKWKKVFPPARKPKAS